MADVKVDTAIDASVIARGCPGMSGADLQNLVNQVSAMLPTVGRANGSGCGQGIKRWIIKCPIEPL